MRPAIDAEAKRTEDYFHVDSIYSVFYSSKRNSCMVAKIIMQDYIKADTAEIDDLFDQRTVWSKVYENEQRGNQVDKDLDREIENLK